MAIFRARGRNLTVNATVLLHAHPVRARLLSLITHDDHHAGAPIRLMLLDDVDSKAENHAAEVLMIDLRKAQLVAGPVRHRVRLTLDGMLEVRAGALFGVLIEAQSGVLGAVQFASLVVHGAQDLAVAIPEGEACQLQVA